MIQKSMTLTIDGAEVAFTEGETPRGRPASTAIHPHSVLRPAPGTVWFV